MTSQSDQNKSVDAGVMDDRELISIENEFIKAQKKAQKNAIKNTDNQ